MWQFKSPTTSIITQPRICDVDSQPPGNDDRRALVDQDILWRHLSIAIYC